MKKASQILLFITAVFIFMMAGILIGRHTSGHHYKIPDNELVQNDKDTQNQEKSGKLNINTASLIQIDDLPGIGPVLAQRIIDYRTKHGSFSSIEDLLLVEGIGEVRLNKMKDYITTGG